MRTAEQASREAMSAASALVARKDMVAAEQVLLQHLQQWREDARALHGLAAILVETHRRDMAARVMERLIALEPGCAEHHLTLAALLEALGRSAELVALYRRMCSALPAHAVAHFNLGCNLRRTGRDAEALAAHRRALELGIDQAEEVLSNIAAILSDQHEDDASRRALEEALSCNPRWLPALYNLGLWYEEHGDRAAALCRFEQVLDLDPNWHDARVRIAWLRRCTGADDPLLAELRADLNDSSLPALARENIQFALGKLLEDCGEYRAAFTAFAAGNAHSRARISHYDRTGTESLFRQTQDSFDAGWLASTTSLSDQPLIFICGMFRSGSTLLEQMLAAHSAVSSGGELDYFVSRLRREDAQWFTRRIAAEAGLRSSLGAGYLAVLAKRFPGAARVTDKRPDNFLFIGLLAALFPNARFLHTRRDPRDTCVSIWCQQLEDSLGYAAHLEDAAHYLGQYRSLMAHWQGLLPGRILDVDYEQLVAHPEPVLRGVCDFLQLDWQPAMLQFHEVDNRVRTASVWQVRQPLYRNSIGRWRNYIPEISALEKALGHAEAICDN